MVKFNPKDISIEFTDDPSLFIKFSLKKYSVYLDFLIDSTSINKTIIFVLYRNSKCISTIEDSLENGFTRLIPILNEK